MPEWIVYPLAFVGACTIAAVSAMFATLAYQTAQDNRQRHRQAVRDRIIDQAFRDVLTATNPSEQTVACRRFDELVADLE